jgi:hypothetical protein
MASTTPTLWDTDQSLMASYARCEANCFAFIQKLADIDRMSQSWKGAAVFWNDLPLHQSRLCEHIYYTG